MKYTLYAALLVACALTLAACEKKASDENPPAPISVPEEAPAPTSEPTPLHAPESAPTPEAAPTHEAPTEEPKQ